MKWFLFLLKNAYPGWLSGACIPLLWPDCPLARRSMSPLGAPRPGDGSCLPRASPPIPLCIPKGNSPREMDHIGWCFSHGLRVAVLSATGRPRKPAATRVPGLFHVTQDCSGHRLEPFASGHEGPGGSESGLLTKDAVPRLACPRCEPAPLDPNLRAPRGPRESQPRGHRPTSASPAANARLQSWSPRLTPSLTKAISPGQLFFSIYPRL